ncbi:MAG: very short patch repair endonuclease [Micrococcales bacterium]|nr:very short patch repair endonuclease [Micrococcales bacterium]
MTTTPPPTPRQGSAAYTPWASSPAVRKVMQSNKGRDTGPELAVRRLVHARGLRYRISTRPEPTLRRTADLVFTRSRVAVFIDGCFWHGCPQHRTHPRTNATYWADKIETNIARDADTSERLSAAGWTVLRFWQHEDPVAVAAAIERAVRPGAEAD